MVGTASEQFYPSKNKEFLQNFTESFVKRDKNQLQSEKHEKKFSLEDHTIMNLW